jgi:hypothetical protein
MGAYPIIFENDPMDWIKLGSTKNPHPVPRILVGYHDMCAVQNEGFSLQRRAAKANEMVVT